MKCKDCIYLTGRKSSVGVECMEPKNQEKWALKEEIRKAAGYINFGVVARYKQPSTRACKRFKDRALENVDCSWGRG